MTTMFLLLICILDNKLQSRLFIIDLAKIGTFTILVFLNYSRLISCYSDEPSILIAIKGIHGIK